MYEPCYLVGAFILTTPSVLNVEIYLLKVNPHKANPERNDLRDTKSTNGNKNCIVRLFLCLAFILTRKYYWF